MIFLVYQLQFISDKNNKTLYLRLKNNLAINYKGLLSYFFYIFKSKTLKVIVAIKRPNKHNFVNLHPKFKR